MSSSSMDHMKQMSSLYSFDNTVFCGFAFYSSLLALKMMIITYYTGYMRMRKKIFVNPEDAKMAKSELIQESDDDVERVRRAHLNDLENIPIFWITGLLLIGVDPNVIFALMMYRIYAIARIAHTIVYLMVVPQPTRSIIFFTGNIVNLIIILYCMGVYFQI